MPDRLIDIAKELLFMEYERQLLSVAGRQQELTYKQWTADKQKRVEAAQAFIDKAEGAGVLNGYDFNVLNQWVNDGCPGKRPRLSFELQGEWLEEQEAVVREAQKEAELREKRKEQQEEARIKLEQEKKWREEWMEKYPAFAQWQKERLIIKNKKIAKEKEEIRERIRVEMETEAERRRVEKEQRDRREKILHKGKWFSTILRMDEFEFVEWCDIADPRDLDAYVETLRISGERERRHWLYKAVQKNWDIPLGECYKLLRTTSKENWKKVGL